MSQGINVSVSVLVGICFLLGLCAGVVRIRQQRRNHQVWQSNVISVWCFQLHSAVRIAPMCP